MDCRSSMARALLAIGRMSPCAITRFICSSGSARTQTVKHDASSNSSVPGSVTMLPLVAITKCGCRRNTSSSASRSARRKVSWPNMSNISLKLAPLDLAVEFDERHVEMLRQQAAERGLAAAAQADQRNTPAILGGRGEMLGHELAGFYEHVRRQPLEELRQQHQI